MRLFIAEKPSLARAIVAGLSGKTQNKPGFYIVGDDVVTWCYGHILELFAPDDYGEKYKRWQLEDLPIVPANWQMKIKPSAAGQFNIVKKLVDKAEIIVNAGDPDREGQLLVDEILEFVGNKKQVLRLLLNALDDKSVRYALDNLRDNREFKGLYESARGRSYADWLVGMNLTRCYTIRSREAGYDGVVNVGRVQTPTMALVVRREDEIKNFKPTTHYKVQINWRHGADATAIENKLIPTTWQMPETTKGLDTEGRLLLKQIADDLLSRIKNVTTGIIIAVERKKKQDLPRLPYSLSALQIEAGKRHSYSPQQVLTAMQNLYEKKLTSYPRSDCEYLPLNQLSDAPIILKNIAGIGDEVWRKLVQKADLKNKSRAFDDKKITAHHAIVPTRTLPPFASLSAIEQNLYFMVAEAYLAQFFPAYVYTATKITVEADGETFVGTGRTVIEQGWRAIYRRHKTDNTESDQTDNEDTEHELPKVKKGDVVKFFDGTIKENVTKPPKRFTPASLVEAMKKIGNFVRDENLKKALQDCSGIGTEATRAGIIEKLQTTGFLRLDRKVLVPTDKARRAMSVLPEEITYPDTTALWEKQLSDVAEKKLSLNTFCQRQTKIIADFLTQAKTLRLKPAKGTVICPLCGRAMKKRSGTKGEFWGCSAYPKCKGSRDIN